MPTVTYHPTWDLVVIVLFIVIVAYSLIIGLNQTWKVTISAYISILVADGMGNVIGKLIGNESGIQIFNIATTQELIAVIKIFIFALSIVIFATKGGFQIKTGASDSSLMKIIVGLTAGLLSASLIVGTIMTYLFGHSLFQAGNVISETGLSIQNQSILAEMITNNYSTLFALPAIAFIITSLGWNED